MNTPVPQHKRARLSHRWIWWIAPPAALVLGYRLIPARWRRLWNREGRSSSHVALAAILTGGGWRAFGHYAVSDNWNGEGK